MFADETLKQMFAKNPDGAGIMWTENGKVRIEKGFMNIEAFLNFIHSKNWAGLPAVLHFRIGTAGGNTPLNCHPYPVYEENKFLSYQCNLAMVHNGILFKYNPVRKKDKGINDTQIFIREIVSHLPKGFQDNPTILYLLQNEIGTNRICFLDNKGKITKLGSFIEDNGYYYSNASYRIYREPIFTRDNYSKLNSQIQQFTFDDCGDFLDNLDDDGLSFADKFVDDVANFQSENSYDQALTELAFKTSQIDKYMFSGQDYDYELDEGSIVRIRKEY